MHTWIVPPIAGLIELNAAPEIIAEGIGAIALKDGRLTVYLYDDQILIDGTAERSVPVVTAKLVGQLGNIPACMAQLAMCLVRPAEPMAPQGPLGPRLVR